MHGQDENFITHFGPCFQPRSPGVTKRNNAISRLTAICKLSLDNAIILDTAQPDKRINRGSRRDGTGRDVRRKHFVDLHFLGGFS